MRRENTLRRQNVRLFAFVCVELLFSLLAACGGGNSGQQEVPLPSTPAPKLYSIAITPSPISLTPGKSLQLHVIGRYSNSSIQDLTAQTTWTSSDTEKIAIDSGGIAIGVTDGDSVITANYSDLSVTSAGHVFRINPSSSTPISQAIAYQINQAHSGRATVGANGPIFPPTHQWSIQLSGGLPSYPLIAGGKVFVITSQYAGNNQYLYAIDEFTGNVSWGPIMLPGTTFAAAAYDHGTLFVASEDGISNHGVLRSFDANTGSLGWVLQLPSGDDISSPPTAINGIVYINHFSALSAVDASTGKILWNSYYGGGLFSSPTVSTDGVSILSGSSVRTYDLITGVERSIPDPKYFKSVNEAGLVGTIAYANNLLYVRGLYNIKLNQQSGNSVGEFSADLIPAFKDTIGFFLSDGTLNAIDQTTGSTIWTFTGDGELKNTPPIVIDNVVVVGSILENIYALDSSTGRVVWSQHMPDSILEGSEFTFQPSGFGAGDGYLVVPTIDRLYAWRLIP